MREHPFDENASILYFRLNSEPFTPAKGRRYVCWPAWMWQVVAPVPRNRPFNLFQELILKMCRAGVRSAEEIHDRIGLGRDLAGFVFLQLQSIGLLDNTGRPTHRAYKLLDKDQDNAPEHITGYIFQDPFSGRIWPRFRKEKLERLQGNFKYDQNTKTTNFTVDSGSVGNPHTFMGTLMRPKPPLRCCDPPTAFQILRSWRMQQQVSTQFGYSLGDHLEQHVVEAQQSLKQVSLISIDPEPVYLMTYIFIPQDTGKSVHWQVCDPFGFSVSPFLQREIEELVSGDQTLKMLLERVTGKALSIEAEDVSELFSVIENRAFKAVENTLGQEIREFPELLRCMTQMEEQATRLSHFSNVSGESALEEQRNHTSAFLRWVYVSFEELLAAIQKFFPSGASCPLNGSSTENGEVLKLIAHTKLGFHQGTKDNRVSVLLNQNGGQLRNVSEFDGRNLPSQVAVMLLSANDHPAHPAYTLAQQMPGWLISLAGLKAFRDTAAHGTKKGDLPSKEEADGLRSLVYQTARLLLPGMRRNTDQSENAEMSAEWQIELQLKARHAASIQVSKQLGPGLRIPSEVRGYLQNMETRALALDKLNAANDYQHTRTVGDLVMQSYRALEASIAALLEETSPIVNDPKASPSQTAKDLGFATLDNGYLPSAFEKVKPFRIKHAAENRSGSLGAMVCALLLDTHPSAQINAIAKKNPRFLLDLARIIEVRGHGGKDLYSSLEDARSIRDTTYILIRDIHENML